MRTPSFTTFISFECLHDFISSPRGVKSKDYASSYHSFYVVEQLITLLEDLSDICYKYN